MIIIELILTFSVILLVVGRCGYVFQNNSDQEMVVQIPFEYVQIRAMRVIMTEIRSTG